MITYGYELELGDVLRDRKIPAHLGSWEYSERDIVNQLPPYQYVCADPLGLEPNRGGEINIFPGHSAEEVADRTCELIEWFRQQGDTPTVSCMSHAHPHVRVLRMRENITKLKNLASWVRDNQMEIKQRVHGFVEVEGMEEVPRAKNYLKWDGGRMIPGWMVSNILTHAQDFDDFIRLHCCGKDAKSMGRPFRYMINMYCMKHIDTIEGRYFRATLDHAEILSSLRFNRDTVVEGSKGVVNGMSAGELLSTNKYQFTPFWFDLETCKGWERTKWGDGRGRKERTLHEI